MAVVNVKFPGNLGQVDTAQDLRALPSTLIADGSLYWVEGLNSLFGFDAGSLADDDGTTVIRPTDRTPLQTGRWLQVVDGFGGGSLSNFDGGFYGA